VVASADWAVAQVAIRFSQITAELRLDYARRRFLIRGWVPMGDWGTRRSSETTAALATMPALATTPALEIAVASGDLEMVLESTVQR